MDILITLIIVAVIGLSVTPFFLMSGQFQPKRKGTDAGEGPVTPVPTTADGPFMPRKPADSDADDDGGDDGDSDRDPD